MKRLTILPLVLCAGVLTACTTPVPEGGAKDADPTVTVTKSTTSVPELPGATVDTGLPDVPDRDVDEPVPCESVHVEGVLAPGEGPTPEQWDTAVVITNLGPGSCELAGPSELEFHTGGDGRPLGINEVTSDDGTQPLSVILDAGDQANMSIDYRTAAEGTRTDCLAGGSFVNVTLPGDDQPVEAWPEDRAAGLPPVCGAVSVTSWYFGGAPGVPR